MRLYNFVYQLESDQIVDKRILELKANIKVPERKLNATKTHYARTIDEMTRLLNKIKLSDMDDYKRKIYHGFYYVFKKSQSDFSAVKCRPVNEDYPLEMLPLYFNVSVPIVSGPSEVSTHRVTLSNGYSIPIIGFGTSRLSPHNGQSEKQCIDSIQSALRTGYRLFDTADDYGAYLISLVCVYLVYTCLLSLLLTLCVYLVIYCYELCVGINSL